MAPDARNARAADLLRSSTLLAVAVGAISCRPILSPDDVDAFLAALPRDPAPGEAVLRMVALTGRESGGEELARVRALLRPYLLREERISGGWYWRVVVRQAELGEIRKALEAADAKARFKCVTVRFPKNGTQNRDWP